MANSGALVYNESLGWGPQSKTFCYFSIKTTGNFWGSQRVRGYV